MPPEESLPWLFPRRGVQNERNPQGGGRQPRRARSIGIISRVRDRIAKRIEAEVWRRQTARTRYRAADWTSRALHAESRTVNSVNGRAGRALMAPRKATPSETTVAGAPLLAFRAPFSSLFFSPFLSFFSTVARSLPLTPSFTHDDPVRSQPACRASSSRCIASPRRAARS